MKFDTAEENLKAIKASKDRHEREVFLGENETRILKLAYGILKHPVTKNDDEYSVALIAVSEALDKYDEDKGAFWSFATGIMRNRLIDLYRKDSRNRPELSLDPAAFEGTLEEEDPSFSVQLEIKDKIAEGNSEIDYGLRDEILEVTEELKSYNVSFFDLAEHSPKTKSTRELCVKAITAFFIPPPLMEALRRTRLFPAKELMERERVSRKFIDKFRKYLITAAVIIDGDYPGLFEDVKYMNPAGKNKDVH